MAVQKVGDSMIDSVIGENIPIFTEQEKFNETITSSVKRLESALTGVLRAKLAVSVVSVMGTVVGTAIPLMTTAMFLCYSVLVKTNHGCMTRSPLVFLGHFLCSVSDTPCLCISAYLPYDADMEGHQLQLYSAYLL